MRLRKLELYDAPLMLEWMHDKNVVANMKANFMEKTLEDCERFIRNSWNSDESLNMAITDDNDEYMGTVSLKDIDLDRRSAEFAITIRSCAMGKGLSKCAMAEIIRKGLEELELNEIYWCVSKINERAVRFYDKNGYQRIDINDNKEFVDLLEYKSGYTMSEIQSYIWYVVSENN